MPGDPDATTADIRAISDLLDGAELRPAAWLGHSAGGTLVLQRAFDPERSPVATLALAPVADLHRSHERRDGNGAVGEWLGADTAADPARFAHLDPVRLLADSPERRDYIICVHGDQDVAVPVSQSIESGLPAVVLPGAHHFDVIDPASDHFPEVVAVLDDLLEREA